MTSKNEKNQFETFIEIFEKAHPFTSEENFLKETIKEWVKAEKSVEKNPSSCMISDKIQEFM